MVPFNCVVLLASFLEGCRSSALVLMAGQVRILGSRQLQEAHVHHLFSPLRLAFGGAHCVVTTLCVDQQLRRGHGLSDAFARALDQIHVHASERIEEILISANISMQTRSTYPTWKA
jgi:hypothetical protein